MNICPKCNKENVEGCAFCGFCGSPMEQKQVTAPIVESTLLTVKKSKKNKIIGFSVVFSILIIIGVILAGYFTNWFGMLSPLHGLIKATEKTVTAKNLTATITVDGDDGDDDELEGDFRYSMDHEARDILFLFEGEEGDKNETKRLLYKGDLYEYDEYEDGCYAYVEEDFVNEKKFFKKYDKIYGEKKQIDWDEAVETLELDDYVDSDEVEEFLKEFYNEKLRNKEWLEKYAGFEKKGNTYIFKPDTADLLEEISDICSDSDAFERKAKKAIKKALNDDFLEDVDLEIKITLKGKYISEIDIVCEYEKEEIEINVKFSDINKTKISEDEIKKLKNDIEDTIEEYTCDECGETTFFEDGMHGDCPECGEHGYIGYGDGVCWDCDYYDDYYYDTDYAGYGYCNRCADYDETYYSYYDHTLCEYCYDDYYYDSLNYGYCNDCCDYAKLYDDHLCYWCY